MKYSTQNGQIGGQAVNNFNKQIMNQQTSSGLGSCLGEEKLPPVVSSMDMLERAIVNLGDEFAALVAKLNYVTSGIPESGQQEMTPKPPASCPLDMRVLDCYSRVTDLAESLRILRDRVCV